MPRPPFLFPDLIMDQEHGTHSDADVAAVCAAGRILKFPVLIRIANSNDYTMLRRAIDLGCVGLLLPTVETTETLDIVRDSILMPPRGRRRPGGWGNSWVSDYGLDAWQTDVEPHFIVWPQIESKTGLANVDAIAAHAITSAIAVGPYDLSAELGTCCDMKSEVMVAALERIREAGKRVGKFTVQYHTPPT